MTPVPPVEREEARADNSAGTLTSVCPKSPSNQLASKALSGAAGGKWLLERQMSLSLQDAPELIAYPCCKNTKCRPFSFFLVELPAEQGPGNPK